MPSPAGAWAGADRVGAPPELPTVSYQSLAQCVEDPADWLAEGRNQLMQRSNSVHLHANGFVKITLPSTGSPIVRRLHIWHPLIAGGAADSNVHSHCWPLASTVVAGALVEELFAATDTGDDFDEYAFHRQSSQLRRAGRSGLRKLQALTHTQGDIYVRASHMLHRVQPACDRLAVSALAHPRERSAESRVFVPSAREVGPNAVPLTDDQRELLVITLDEVEMQVRASRVRNAR